MKKLTYLFAFFALSFGLSINAQSSLDDLTDAKSGGANLQFSNFRSCYATQQWNFKWS